MSAPINRPNGLKAISTVDSENHPDIDVLCGWLQSIMLARDARVILDAGDLPANGSVVVLPMWTWMHSAISVGRKDHASDGGRLLLPVRLSWSTPSVVVIADGNSVDANYTLLGMGHSGAGETTISSSVDAPVSRTGLDGNLLPSVHEVRPTFQRMLVRELNKLVEDGEAAKWAMTMWLDKWTQHAVFVAHTALCFDVFGKANYAKLLDDCTLSAIADDIMFSSAADNEIEAKPSAFARMLERCLNPSTFIKVDPLKYILTTIRENADRAVRSRADDPHIGPKIREVARRHNLTDVSQIVAVYKGLYPKDRLERRRATKALTVRPDVMAGSLMLGSVTDDNEEPNAQQYSDIYGNIVSK